MNAQARFLGVVLCALTVTSCDGDPVSVDSPASALRPGALSHLAPGGSPVTLSGLGTATIDGHLAPGEWDRAGVVDFVFSDGVESRPSRLYVMNDETDLYIAVVITNEDFNGSVASQSDVLDIFFDNDHDGGIAWSNSELGDDFLQAPVPHEGRFWDGFTCTAPCEPSLSWQRDPIDAGTPDADAAVTHTDPVPGHIGTYTFEFRKTLNSGDAAHDFALSSGDVVGVFLEYVDTPVGASGGSFNTWPGPSACFFGVPACVGADIRIASPVLPVQIDVKPGSSDNTLNPRSNGVTWVAILTTPGFGAATVDAKTVRFGPANAAPVRSVLEDVDGDRDADMLLRFDTRSLGIRCDDSSVVLIGRTRGGQSIRGSDSIRPVGCK